MSWLSKIFKKKQQQPSFEPLEVFDFSLEEAETTPPVPKAKTALSISKIPPVKGPVLSYGQSRNLWATTDYRAPEYDLVEIGILEDTEAYVHQAFAKKIGLMFKEGFDFVGKNKDTIQYIKTRLAQVARASSIPTILLKQRTATSLIRTSNAFLVKVRDEKASGGGVRRTPAGRSLKPVAAYFPVAPETMQVKLDVDSGKIQSWRQLLPDGRYKDFSPDDVIHFTTNKREGFVFGTPDIIPVMDDIRALRNIEENIELLLYQYLFPLFHYKVGTETRPAGWTEDGKREIDVVREEIQYMPSEGGIVTPERHEIKMIGAEGRAMRAESYLEHFKKRVIAGLGISTVDLGDGNTTNRATAKTLSRQLIDTVKALQDLFEAQWDQEVVSELLLESTFKEDVLEESNMVHLQFAEIDLENRMEQEKHAVELFKGNGITYAEFRHALGREPIPLPEDPHDQDPAKYPEWHSTYWKLFEEPALVIRAIDEAWQPQAKAAAEARSIGVTSTSLAQSTQEQEKAAQAEAERQAKIKKAAPPKPPAKVKNQLQDHFLGDEYRNLKQELLTTLKTTLPQNPQGAIQNLVNLWAIYIGDKFFKGCYTSYIEGVRSTLSPRHPNYPHIIQEGKGSIEYRVKGFVSKLSHDLERELLAKADLLQQDTALAITIFDALQYRIDFMADAEPSKAFTYGQLSGRKLQEQGVIHFTLRHDACQMCRERSQVDLSQVSLERVIPHHPGCKCEVANG